MREGRRRCIRGLVLIAGLVMTLMAAPGCRDERAMPVAPDHKFPFMVSGPID